MSDARATLDRAMAEDELLSAVVEAARLFGWLCHHDRRSDKAVQQGDAGFPDLVLARGGWVRFYELKTTRGNLSTAQFGWQLALEPISRLWGCEYRVIRPADLDSVIASLR